MRNPLVDNTILLGLFLLIGVGIWLNFTIRTEGMQCRTNPFQYSTKVMEEVAKSPLTCRCGFENKTYPDFTYTNSTIEAEELEQDSRLFYYNNNMSDIIKKLNFSL